jgi:hypothetical protein
VGGSIVVVVGTLGGAIVGALGAFGLDFLRWRRERGARWDERRLLSYSRYLACAAQVHAEVLSPSSGNGAKDQSPARFNKRYNTLASIYEELVLLDPGVQSDARRLLWILWNLHDMVGQDGAALEVVAEATRTYQDARLHIRMIAIEHLQLSASELPDVERCNTEAHDAEIGHVPRSSPWA